MNSRELLKTEFPEMMEKCFDCSIKMGWYELVFDLMEILRDIDPNIKVRQIKEKFGGLRFYTENTVSEETQHLINMTEKESLSVCEFTGKKGMNRKIHDWWKTCCDEIAEEVLRYNSWTEYYMAKSRERQQEMS